MNINEDKIWNKEFTSYTGKHGEEPKAVENHRAFIHNINWWDAKTNTVAEIVRWSESEQVKICNDMVDLLLLVKHESEDDGVLQLDKGIYIERDIVPEGIYQFRYCDETKDYQYAPIEGELLAFSLVMDIPLMRIFNEDELNLK